MEEKVKKVLEVIGADNIREMSRADCAIALGRLLSVKVKGRASKHEVTKEVREAMEIVLMSPLGKNVEEAIKTAIYMTPPFHSEVLNQAYKMLLEQLLRKAAEEVKALNPMWAGRLVNITTENIFIVASSEKEYKDKIFTVLGEGGEESE